MFRAFQFDLSFLCYFMLFSKLYESKANVFVYKAVIGRRLPLMCGQHFHLLFGSAVRMAYYCYHTPQLHPNEYHINTNHQCIVLYLPRLGGMDGYRNFFS